jgi:hypothetical protein
LIENATLKILSSEATISASCQAIFAHRNYGGYSQLFPKNVTGIHLAAYFGLSDMISMLTDRGYHPDVKDSVGLTPFSWAARNEHETVVKLLLAKTASTQIQRTGNCEPHYHGLHRTAMWQL